MATPAPWLPPADVLGYLKVAAGSENAYAVELCRVAAARVVERARRDLKLAELPDPLPADADVPEDVKHGALLLTARLYARKGSPQGVATFGELGASTILRSDPDVQLLLGVGRFGRPVAR